MPELTLTLPFPPSSNTAFGQRAGHQRYKSAKYVAWLYKCPKLQPLMLKTSHVVYRIWFPDDRVRDSANYEKLVTDYLVSQQVLVDDNWKVIKSMLTIPMGIDRKNPRVEIVLEIH